MSELSNGLLLAYIGVMALVTYLIRLLPLVLFTQKINNVFVRSFLYYVPYAVLGAMTVPAIFTSTNSVISAVLGGLTAVFSLIGKRACFLWRWRPAWWRFWWRGFWIL